MVFLISEMSVGLNESENYIWNTETDCLGEGTFGKVYLGVNKRTGDKVAVKTFKYGNHLGIQEIKMLKTLKHQYIIQLYAIETDEYSKSTVLIMELCNGGSLMNFLNEPENACGLVDSEFLLVFEHLSGGLEYLKKHNVIHRDVKPDNIMRHIFDDGRIIYKLADFGTARELPEGQNFYSLHGTEPYLHPQMFGVCFFKDEGFPREFGANTDLWSIGVTLFQTATGHLPFLVQDRHVMLSVYKEMKKNDGIISAVQVQNSERVMYQSELPRTSRLSLGLKQLITPVIAGLFVQHADKQWSFTEYHEHVLEMISRKVINVFYVNKMQMLKVYIKPEETFNDFKYYICMQSEVTEANQVFLYKHNLIVSSFDEIHNVNSECIFLFDRSEASVVPTINIHLIFENLSNFHEKFMSDPDDLRLAHYACKDLSLCKNLMDYQSEVQRLFSIFIKNFGTYCKEEQKEQRKVYDILLEKYSSFHDRADILEKLQKLSRSQHSDFVEEFKNTTNIFVEKASQLIDNLVIAESEGSDDTTHASYLKIVSKELSDMKGLIKTLISSKHNNKLYSYQKIKIVHCVRTIMEILTDKMEPNFEGFVNYAKNWYKSQFFSQVRSLSQLKKLLHGYRYDLKKYEEEIHSQSNASLNSISTVKSGTLNKEKLLKTLEGYRENNKDMKFLIEENEKLIQEMSELILTCDITTDL